MDRWQGRDHACVAFIAHHTDSAGLCNAKIDAADSNVRSKKNFTQNLSRGVCEGRNILGVRNTKLFLKEAAHIIAAKMDSRSNDMCRFFTSQLDNVFTQIRFYNVNTFCFQRVVKMDLFGDHRFGFGNQNRTPTTLRSTPVGPVAGTAFFPTSGGVGLRNF